MHGNRPAKSGLASGVLLSLAGAAVAQEPPRLSLPIACGDGVRCLVQSYVDIDRSSEYHDYACGTSTYDGHKGTDFRLLSAAQVAEHVAVLASADGTVKGMRDGMEDQFITPDTQSLVKNRECGNGAVVDHGGGWETQYCHLRKGSLAVKTGDAVKRGQRIGDVGYSGLVEFAHLHLEVRKDGNPIDPFSGIRVGDACLTDTTSLPGALWDEAAAKALPYARGQIVSAQFSAEVPGVQAIERDHTLPAPTPGSDQLVFVARFLNLSAGDVIELTVRGPQGFAVDDTSRPLEHSKATYLAYAGKKRTSPAWVPGVYAGRVRLLRGGAAVSEQDGSLTIGAP